MKSVKIISGAYGHQVGNHVEAKTRADKPFELSDIEAERLVALGVAEIVGDSLVATPGNEQEEEDAKDNSSAEDNAAKGAEGDFPPVDNDTSKEYGEGSTVSELRAVGKKYGITFKVGMTKAEMIEALDKQINFPPTLNAESVIE